MFFHAGSCRRFVVWPCKSPFHGHFGFKRTIPNFLIIISFLLIIPEGARARVRTRTRDHKRVRQRSALLQLQMVLALTLVLVLTLALAPSGMINEKGMIIKKFGVYIDS